VTGKTRLTELAQRPWKWVVAGIRGKFPKAPRGESQPIKHTLVEASQSEDKFTAFALNFPGLVWIKDERGRYKLVNPVAEVIHHRPLAQWIGKTDDDIFPLDTAEQFNRNDRQVLSSGQSLFSTEWILLDGRIHHMMTSRFLIREANQTLIGGIAIDISDGVSSVRELASMRRHMFAGEPTKSIMELSSIIGHDLNNTLNAVMLRMSLFATATMDAEQEANVARIESLVERAAASVRRLQEFANAQRPFSESTELDVMLRDELRALDGNNSFPPLPATVKSVLTIAPSELPKVSGNAGEVRYVIATLLRNAQEAMPDGGTITVSGRAIGDRVVVTIADEGIGLSEDHLAHLFDPFYTTKATLGSGLGLAGSFGIMSRLGGTIAATNLPEGGAIFTLDFPIMTDVKVSIKPERFPDGGPDGSRTSRQRILVIDDDIDNLEAMREALQGRGYEVETAPDGKRGLELLRLSPHFDSVICDVGMPIMNGWDVAQEITRVAPSTRVYMLTGWANEIPQSDPRRAGVEAVIAKPVSLEQIDAAIARK
jgi:signal transduction histidine kinase/CheY-like chemotaxis protein